ncbi:MAG: DNA adenine methylase [Bacteroidia bacterium]|nr:MAG: DNA adenine methylase [Bacteroidia bacterium]
MKIPHPIPYQGSKRNIAHEIMRFFPKQIDRLIEPFAGSAAISIASAFYYKADKFIINDINKPLIELWKMMVNFPEKAVKNYYDIWTKQLGNEEKYYYQIREKFNKTQEPKYLLFLLAKCVKAAVRYNSEGNFNQSPDKRRKGRRPENMRYDILHVSNLLKGKTEFYSMDYEKILELASPKDLLYLDPPYQGTAKSGGFRYLENLSREDFIISLHELNERNIPFLLSYDGRTGGKTYGEELPKRLNLTKIEIDAGRSSTATLHSRNQRTFEALYLSKNIAQHLDFENKKQSLTKQPTLFDNL